jgi:D-xylose transport system permease protein
MASDNDEVPGEPIPGTIAVEADPHASGEAPVDAALVSSAPDLLANSLGEYTRIWFRRVRSGESGALPVILGLVAIVIYFQISQPSFLSAGNIANLMGQAGFLITLAMAQTFPLLLGEIDLSLGFNMGIGATVTVWMVSINHPYPTWLAILAGIVLCGAISAIEGLIIVWLRIPSFVVTLAGLLGLNGVLLWLYEQTGSVGNGGVIQLHNDLINNIVAGNLSPVAGWIALIIIIALAAVFMIARDQRRRSHNLVAPPLSVTVLKLAVIAAIGVVLLLVLNHNRAVGLLEVLEGVPYVVPVILVLLALTSVLLTRTKFGRYMYAVGGNAEAARRAGISLSRIRVLAFMICGLMAGVSGLLYASYLGSISNNVDGGQYVLFSVAGAVIGGVSLFGGRGRIVGAVLGGFIVAVIYNGVILIGLGAAGQYIWTAVVLLAAVTLDALARRGSTTT